MHSLNALFASFTLLVAQPPAGEYRDLFNGKNLDGWIVEGPTKDKEGKPMWSVADGTIVCLGKGFGFLRYDKQQFGDFALRVEYRFAPPSKTNPRGNSGLGIRTIPFDPKQSTLTRPSYASFEIQLLDDAGKPASDHGTASLYRYLGPTKNVVKPAPEWNTIEVECVGPRIKITMNGTQILDADQTTLPDLKGKPKGVAAPKDKPLRGYVCLQSHTGKVEFRKAQIREIPKKAGAFLPGAKRILFLGDSITYDGKYVSCFETELRLHLRDRTFDVISCGLPSETVSGLSEDGHAGGKFPRPDLHERLDRVLAKIKPDLVFACYGMNDGIYLPLAEQRFQKYQEGIAKLRAKVEAAGAKIIHLTPAVFDAAPIAKRVAPADKVTANNPFAGYDQVLDAYSAWLLQQRAKGWHVIDIHGPMTQALAKVRADKPAFTFAADGVHPNQAGHMVIAQALLQGLKPPFAFGADEFGDINDGASLRGKVFKLVHERTRLLTDAWLSDTGHKRPLKAGLPLEEAKTKAAALDEQIQALLGR